MRCWPRLAWWLLDICILNAFKLWAIGKQGARQLDFRIQLMHVLVKLLEADQQALQVSRGLNASVATAAEHYSMLTEEPCKRTALRCSNGGNVYELRRRGELGRHNTQR
jgi:hypothetical protein